MIFGSFMTDFLVIKNSDIDGFAERVVLVHLRVAIRF
jgi:hypothetical protein